MSISNRENTNITINGVIFKPLMRSRAKCNGCDKGFTDQEFRGGEVNYSKTKRGTEIYMCDKCYTKYYGMDQRQLALLKARSISGV